MLVLRVHGTFKFVVMSLYVHLHETCIYPVGLGVEISYIHLFKSCSINAGCILNGLRWPCQLGKITSSLHSGECMLNFRDNW
jgi:hypothetical protein